MTHEQMRGFAADVPFDATTGRRALAVYESDVVMPLEVRAGFIGALDGMSNEFRATLRIEWGMGKFVETQEVALRYLGNIVRRAASHVRVSVQVTAVAANQPAEPPRMFAQIAPAVPAPSAVVKAETANILAGSNHTFTPPPFATEVVMFQQSPNDCFYTFRSPVLASITNSIVLLTQGARVPVPLDATAIRVNNQAASARSIQVGWLTP